MRRSNEGKACDFVVRYLEAREQSLRCDVSFPERERDPNPVELTCRIGGHLFAIEHTSIEPFERHYKFEEEFPRHLQVIQNKLNGELPPDEHFELWLPVMATMNLKAGKLYQVLERIANWIRVIAPKLPVAHFSSRMAPLTFMKIPEVPFRVSLRRLAGAGIPGHLSVKHLLSGAELEQKRRERIARAYRKKIGKLAAWQKRGARCILVFEEDDIQMTNQAVIADALMKVENKGEFQPDEIYLISSAIDVWWLYVMRMGDHKYYGPGQSGEPLMELDPATLNDLTEKTVPRQRSRRPLSGR